MTFSEWFDQAYPQSAFVGSMGSPLIAMRNGFREVAEAAWNAANPILTPAEIELRRKSDLLWTDAMVRAAYEDAAKIAEGFVIDETQAPSIRASRIASAIRARANGGKEE